MNTDYVISKEGYRKEDLNEENQNIIDWLRYIEKEFESEIANYCNDGNNSILERIYNEIAAEVLDDALINLHLAINDVQIHLAESEPEK